MPEKRAEPRFLCSDLVKVRWLAERGNSRLETVVLENISASGACVQAEVPIPESSRVTLLCRSAEFAGLVRSCYQRDGGYFIGIEFDDDSRWSRAQFQPEHLLDPRTVKPRKLASKLIMFGAASLQPPELLWQLWLYCRGSLSCPQY